MWTDALTVSSKGQNNWVSPLHRLTAALAHTHALGASGTITAQATPWEKWWSGLGPRCGSCADVIAVRRLDHPSDRLRSRPAEARQASRDRNVFAQLGLQAPLNASGSRSPDAEERLAAVIGRRAGQPAS